MSSLLSDNHRALKDAILVELRDVARLAEVSGMSTLARDLSHTRIPKLEQERFTLVVLGEFNHGKSTFVNALLGATVLPAGITPTTATINHLVYAPEPTARAVMQDESVRVLGKPDPKTLGEWVTIDGQRAGLQDQLRYVEVGWPADILKDRVTLVDTPGVNDINEARAEITYNYIPRADAVLFLLDGVQVLKQSERAFLEQRILQRSKDKLIFIVGKADLLSKEELEDALRYCRQNLSKIIDDPVIFGISAKLALAGETERSGVVPLLAYLRKFLAEQRARIMLDNASGDGLRLSGYLRQNLGIKRRSLQLSLGELEERIAKVRAELSGKQQTIRQIHSRITAEAEAIKAKVRLDTEDFIEAFCAALPKEIDKVEVADLRRYLQPYLQDTLKNWAEGEGEHLAGLLERLAEEIIQITNENVQQVVSVLAAELGPADTEVKLELDTLKYDVGVFALGALGTGIFLFVNTFVGGLMTLAAPIIAILIRGRIALQLKDQAKEQALKVVREAQGAILPRFAQVVDDFAARLADFVTAAGQALHKGISEMLDRALSERRTAGVDIEARDRELGAQLQALSGIEDRISKLRQRLWLSSTDSTASPAASAS